jgi:hypothetical protein
MATKLGASAAISKAETAANAWYNTIKSKLEDFEEGGSWTVGVKNDGTDDFVTPDVEKSVVDTWKNKSDFKGFERRGSLSSGEAKIDLKLAYPGRAESSFNYHIKVMVDPEIEKRRKEQAAAAKKLADENKKKLEAAAAAKKQADIDAAAQKKADAARQKKLDDAANKAWNTFKTTAAYKKTTNEKDWKAKWIKDNAARVK